MFDFLKTPIIHHAYLLANWPKGTLEALRSALGEILGVDNPLASPDYEEGDFGVFGLKDSHNLRERQARAAFGLAGRFFVLTISSATLEAQNALLKTLEEPMAGVHFFILARSEEIFLPTLKSRFLVVRPEVPESKEALESAHRFAADFLRLSPPARLEHVKKNFLKNKDVSKKEVLVFLDQLESKLYDDYRVAGRQAIGLAGLEEIAQAKKHLNNPRSSVRLILEHLSLVI